MVPHSTLKYPCSTHPVYPPTHPSDRVRPRTSSADPHVVVVGDGVTAADDVDGAASVDHGRVPLSRSPRRAGREARPRHTCSRRARHLKPIAPNATAHARPPGAAGQAINTAGPRRASTAPAQRRSAHTRAHTHATHARRCLPKERQNTLALAHERALAQTHARAHARTHGPAHAHKCAHERARKLTHEPHTSAWTLPPHTRAHSRTCANAKTDRLRDTPTLTLTDSQTHTLVARTHTPTRTQHARARAHTHARTRACLFACMCVCVFASTRAHAHAHACVCVCVPVCVCVCVPVCVCVCVCNP